MNPHLTTAWEKHFHGPIVGPSLGQGGRLFLADHLSRLQCFSPRGEALWTRDLQAAPLALAANPETGEAAVLVKPGRMAVFSGEGQWRWTTDIFVDPAGLDVRPDGRAWLLASHTGRVQEFNPEGRAGSAYHFNSRILAACYLGEQKLAGVDHTGRLVLLNRRSGRYQVFPLNHYVGSLGADREGAVLALAGYKEGIFLVRPAENRMDTCSVELNVLAAAVSRDGGYLLAGTEEGSLLLIRGGETVICNHKLDESVGAVALSAELDFAAGVTASGRLCVLEAAAVKGDRYAFVSSEAAVEAVPELAPHWAIKLFQPERRRRGPRRLWYPPGGEYLLTLDEYQLFHVVGADGKVLVKRDFLGDRLKLVLNPSGQLALIGDEFQLAAISLKDRTIYPLPGAARAFSAGDRGGLVLLGRDQNRIELHLLGQPPAAIWNFETPSPFLDLCLAPSGERWFGIFADGWLRAYDVDHRLLWEKPVFAVPEIAAPGATPASPGGYLLKPWGRNLLVLSEWSVTAYDPEGEQLWCAYANAMISHAVPLADGVLIRERDNTYKLVAPDGVVRLAQKPRSGKAYFFLDKNANPAFILMEGTQLVCQAGSRTLWRYQAPDLVEDAAAGEKGVAAIAGERLLWLESAQVVQKTSRFDYLDL